MCRKSHRILAIVAETSAYRHENETYIHSVFGRVVDALAQHYESVLLCVPTFFNDRKVFHDYLVQADNVQIAPQPPYETSLEALLQPTAMARAYSHTLQHAEDIFVRGMLPYSGLFYWLARRYHRRPVHWIVGNPIALLLSHRRSGWIKDALGLLYAYQDRHWTRIGRWLTDGAFLCNGDELAQIYASRRTRAVVSSTITEDDFSFREDTCQDDPIRILFIGFVRPEKGLEYLIEALPKLKCGRPWLLTIVGSSAQHEQYRARLDERIQELGITSQIQWQGHVSHGLALWEYLRSHDVFVLPSLSEGTPRVLVEARANSLPVIATDVGGIPTSVINGFDGLLVPPKDPDAIARALDKVMTQDDLRRTLIRGGQQSARRLTIGCFVETVLNQLRDKV